MSLKNERLIGIVQPKTKKDLYSIGCLGKITGFTETEDKRYIVNLKGISKFKIIEEVKNEYLFREFKVEYLSAEIENTSQEKLKGEFINSELDINQLKKIPGIDKLSSKIYNYVREPAFSNINDLLKIKGIGPKRLESIKNHLNKN